MRSTDQSSLGSTDYDVAEILELDRQDPDTLTPLQRQKLADGKASFMREYNRSKWDRENSAFLDSQKKRIIKYALNMMHTRPSYDRKKGELTVAGFKVKFTLGTDSEVILQKLFWGGKPVKYPVDRGELKSTLGLTGSDTRGNNKAFYRRVDHINMTISKQTGIAKFLVASNKKLWFNPDHQDLYP